MPRITVKLASSYENISRPVCMGLARDVMVLCDIDEKTPVFMPGEFEQVNQPNTEMGGSGEAIFESFERIIVVAEDNMRQESVLNQVVRQNELPPMLEDNRLGISVRPVYMQSDITLSFRYICSTRQQAIKWRDEFAARRAENRTSVSHEISYKIPVQDGVIGLLAHLHHLREKTAGYGETFNEYFRSIQKREFIGLGTQDGDIDKLLIAVPEKQVEVTGWFDFNEIPKETKISGNSTWEIQFTYRLMYHRATHLYISYPLMVHQSHISKTYFSSRPRYCIEELNKNGAIGIKALDAIDGQYNHFPAPADGMRIPAYDEWIPQPRSQPPMSVSAISWMIQLNPKDSQDILNLTQLPDMRLTLEMDTYLKVIYKTLHKRGGGLCFLTLYANDMPLDEAFLTVDKDLNVRATVPLDLRKQYHLRLNFPTAYMLFNKATIRLMQTHNKATLQTFQSILPSLDVEYALSLLIGGLYLPEAYIAWFYKYLEDHGTGFAPGTGGIGEHVNTGSGEGGGLPQGGGVSGIGGPGSGNNSGGNGNGPTGPGNGGQSGGDGSAPTPAEWTKPVWQRRGTNGNHWVQWLIIATANR